MNNSRYQIPKFCQTLKLDIKKMTLSSPSLTKLNHTELNENAAVKSTYAEEIEELKRNILKNNKSINEKDIKFHFQNEKGSLMLYATSSQSPQ